MNKLKSLQLLAKNFSILYVEDNKLLRNKASVFFKKFFKRVDLAKDGEDGLTQFKKFYHPIVITDIKMPKMDGIILAKHIKKLNPDTKIIIMSAFDDKELLFDSIKLGIFRFLTKPVDINELSETLLEVLKVIKDEYNSKLFYSNLSNVFNYQSAMVVMINGKKPIFTNKNFLNFFNVENIEEFNAKYTNITDIFMPHDSFLYNQDGIDALKVLQNNEKKLFHVKIENQSHNIRHFILKYQYIPQKSNIGILSFDDISELNLLQLFDEKQSYNDKKVCDNKKLFDLLNLVKQNNAKIDIHNFYKGLSITNDAIVIDTMDDILTIKTTYLQQKAILYEKKTILVSDVFPTAIECKEVLMVKFDDQTIRLKDLRFIQNSAIDRETIRIVPEENHKVSLFIKENKFNGEIKIEDISLKSVRLNLDVLPAGLEEDSEVIIDIVFTLDKKPFILNIKAKVFKKIELKNSFDIVLLFCENKQKELTKYITKRQMAIIREFKGLQNG